MNDLPQDATSSLAAPAPASADLERELSEWKRRYLELDRFAHVVAHDLRSPLRAVEHLSSWVLEAAPDSLAEESLRWLEEIRGRVGRMKELVEDIFAYSLTSTSPEWIERTPCSDLIARILTVLHVPPGFEVLPDDQPLPVLRTRRVPLEQVLRNLIDNAIKHHDRAQGIVRIGCRQVSPERMRFEVRDDGPGIPQRLRARVFQPFCGFSSQRGSGLGLSVVKRIVEENGGAVELVRNHPRGSVFRFTWPVWR